MKVYDRKFIKSRKEHVDRTETCSRPAAFKSQHFTKITAFVQRVLLLIFQQSFGRSGFLRAHIHSSPIKPPRDQKESVKS